jgi:uncharacterized protein YndB with AHSA1/START domain
MTQRSVTHATFTLERVYDAEPERVYRAFATEEGKARWFTGAPGEWELLVRTFDFRPGGREVLKGRWGSGTVTEFDARYFDIIPQARIVYAYDMWRDGQKLSVSLATIELKPEGRGTRLTMTEQGAFLDGYDDAGSRERGTAELLEQVAQSLETGAAEGVNCG